MVHNRRAERYAARRYLWQHSAVIRVPGKDEKVVNPGLRRCGRVMRSEGVQVKMSAGSDGAGLHAGFGGLVTCGSAWSCPVCAAKIAARRSLEIGDALGRWVAGGGQVAMVTLTMRHHAKERGVLVGLLVLWTALLAAWALMTSGRWWVQLQEDFGAPLTRVVKSGKNKGQLKTSMRIRLIRVVEVTHGRHGWHPHLHVLMLLPASIDLDALNALRDRVALRWGDALTSLGLQRPDEHGTDARFLTEAEARAGVYLTKSGRGELGETDVQALANEAAYGALKTARRTGSMTPLGILARIIEADQAGAGTTRQARRLRALWREWEMVSRNRRQIAWSAGLREELAVIELTDEEAAAEVLEGDTVWTMDARVWRYVTAHGFDYAILTTFERSLAAGRVLMVALEERAGEIAGHMLPPPPVNSP